MKYLNLILLFLCLISIVSTSYSDNKDEPPVFNQTIAPTPSGVSGYTLDAKKNSIKHKKYSDSKSVDQNKLGKYTDSKDPAALKYKDVRKKELLEDKETLKSLYDEKKKLKDVILEDQKNYKEKVKSNKLKFKPAKNVKPLMMKEFDKL